MCSAVCQQSHSRVPARTDQSRSVTGSRPLITHEIAASRSLAVTVMMLRAYEHPRRGMGGSPLVTPIRALWSGLSGTELGFDFGLEDFAYLGPGQVGPDLDLLGGLHAAQPLLDER